MKKTILFTLALLPAITSAAESVFDATVSSIISTNEELKARHKRYIADIETEKAENMLQGPEAEFDYKFGPSGVENRWGVSVSQGFDWPGLYTARRKAARYNADAFRQLYNAARTEITLQTRTLLLDYVKARRNAALLTQAEKNLRTFAENLEKSYEHESATILMVKKSRRELFSLVRRRAEAEAEVVRIAENIKALGDGSQDLDAVDSYPEMPFYSLEQYRTILAANDPAMAAYTSLINASNAAVSVSKASRLPSFSLGFAHDFEDGNHFNGFSIGISLPAWGRNHSKYAAKAAVLAAVSEKENYAQGIDTGLAADWTEASKLAEQLEPVAEEFADDNYLELLAKSFYGGQMSMFEYLREMNEFIDFQVSLNDLQHRYCTVLARLNRFNTPVSE